MTNSLDPSGGPQGDKLFVTSKGHNKPIIMSLTQWQTVVTLRGDMKVFVTS